MFLIKKFLYFHGILQRWYVIPVHAAKQISVLIKNNKYILPNNERIQGIVGK